jgi:GNAT superfamily N-acetyltransferase
MAARRGRSAICVASRMMQLIADPADRQLEALAALLAATFADPDTILGLDRLQEFVAAPDGPRAFRVLVASQDGRVVGGSVFSYVPASNCGFSEYIVVAAESRGRGLGRALFEARRLALDALAAGSGYQGCNGLFIEVDSPRRTPPDYLARERVTALDAAERLRVFAHLGFRRLDMRYVQPPLAVGKSAVDYLDLLFAPWVQVLAAVPAQWVLDTVEPIWRSWSPMAAETYLAEMRRRLGDRPVRLLD